MLNKRHEQNNLTRLQVGDAVLSRRLPFSQLLLWQVSLIVKLMEVPRLHAWCRPDLGGGGHLRNLLAPAPLSFLPGSLLGGAA